MEKQAGPRSFSGPYSSFSTSMAMALLAPIPKGFIQDACGFLTALRRDLPAAYKSTALNAYPVLYKLAAATKEQPWWFRWEIGLSAMTVVSECISAALEQASPHKLVTAEYGLIMAIVSLLLASADLAYQRYKHHKSTLNGRPHGPFKWEFACCFGLVFSVLTLISASLHFHYLRSGKQQPIRFSMMPLAFSVCVFCSTIFRRPSGNSSLTMEMECKCLGAMKVEVEVERLYGPNGPLVQIPCPLCLNGHMHSSPSEVIGTV